MCVVHVLHFYERVCLSVSEKGEVGGWGGLVKENRRDVSGPSMKAPLNCQL